MFGVFKKKFHERTNLVGGVKQPWFSCRCKADVDNDENDDNDHDCNLLCVAGVRRGEKGERRER